MSVGFCREAAIDHGPGLQPISVKVKGTGSIWFLPPKGQWDSPGVLTPGTRHTMTRPERAEDLWRGRFVSLSRFDLRAPGAKIFLQEITDKAERQTLSETELCDL